MNNFRWNVQDAGNSIEIHRDYRSTVKDTWFEWDESSANKTLADNAKRKTHSQWHNRTDRIRLVKRKWNYWLEDGARAGGIQNLIRIIIKTNRASVCFVLLCSAVVLHHFSYLKIAWHPSVDNSHKTSYAIATEKPLHSAEACAKQPSNNKWENRHACATNHTQVKLSRRKTWWELLPLPNWKIR